MPDDDDNKQLVRGTREVLHRQVWETPMSRLAAQYGISGNGLAKICGRLKVPYPPRGYWAKKAAGKKVIDYQLPPADGDTVREVTITPTPPPAQPPKLSPDLEKKAERAREQAETSPVPNRLTKPHPVIASWLKDYERCKEEARRERDPWRKRLKMPDEFTSTDRRQHRSLDALFKELERQGGSARRRSVSIGLPSKNDTKRSSAGSWMPIAGGTSLRSPINGATRR